VREEIDEQLAWLCHVQVEGGPESVEVEMQRMSREELERVLRHAVRELLDTTERAEREINRYARRMNKKRRD
jgi:hypothetical protein